MVNKSMGKPRPVNVQVLLDSGGSGTIMCKSLAKKVRIKKDTHTTWTTLAGKVSTATVAKVQFKLPEFFEDWAIEYHVHLTKKLQNYNMIIGQDLLCKLGININFSNSTCSWEDSIIPMKPLETQQSTSSMAIEESGTLKEATKKLKKILDAKYEPVKIDKVVFGSHHLTFQQKSLLDNLLRKYEPLFDGSLGHWKAKAVHLELKEGAQPYHARPYPIPKSLEIKIKLEIERLIQAGVLKKVNHSEWGAPNFVIPKKDDTIRFISDFRELNKRIKRKPYPIPKIQDLLMKLEAFQWATSLDLNMGYYHIELNPDARKLCTIVMPWGKYEYQRLPMGLCNSPDIFQEHMSELFFDLEYVRAYIDDLLTFTTGSFEDHLSKLDKVLNRLQKTGLKVNAGKSFFAKTELEYLGYWITRQGIQPLPKKVEAIRNLAPPKTRRQLRSFIGLINYYRDMWAKRSELLAPHLKLTSDKTNLSGPQWNNKHLTR